MMPMSRWERNTAAKLVTKLLSGDQSLQNMPSLPSSMSTALSKALGSLPEHLQGGVHPQHVLLEMSDETKSHIAGQPIWCCSTCRPDRGCAQRHAAERCMQLCWAGGRIGEASRTKQALQCTLVCCLILPRL